MSRKVIEARKPVAVSYTHLDVYKRQAQGCSANGSAPSSAAAAGKRTKTDPKDIARMTSVIRACCCQNPWDRGGLSAFSIVISASSFEVLSLIHI